MDLSEPESAEALRIQDFPDLRYRVAHQVVNHLLLTSKQKFPHSKASLYLNATLNLMSTKHSVQPDGAPSSASFMFFFRLILMLILAIHLRFHIFLQHRVDELAQVGPHGDENRVQPLGPLLLSCVKQSQDFSVAKGHPDEFK